MLEPKLANIPQFLKQESYWCVWAYIQRNGKLTKPPIRTNCKFARPNDTSTWDPFAKVCEFFEKMQGKAISGINVPLAGIGVLFHSDSKLTGVDIDHVINPDGSIVEWAEPFINDLASITYCEISPSGTGIHAYVYAEKPSNKCKGGPDNNLEVYEAGRYFTVTGHKLDGCQDTAASGEIAQAMIDKLVEYIQTYGKPISTVNEIDANEWIAAADAYVASTIDSYEAERSLSDDEVIQKASTAKNGGQFTRLFYHGNSGYPSASETEIALCNKLAWWTKKDAAQMDRLMRQSALLQDPERLKKWDSRRGDTTYGEITIAKAIADCKGEYGDTLKKKSKGITYERLPDTGKPKIVYAVGEIPRIIAEFDKAIHDKAWRNDKFVVDVVKQPEAKPYKGVRIPKESKVISRHTVESLSLLASKCVTWTRYKKDGNKYIEVFIDPPTNIMRLYLAAKNDWTLPILTGIASCPLLRPDGSLLNKPGYDADTGLYCDFNPKDFPTVKSNPDKKDASSALGWLYAALAEFPFKTDTDRAVALAAMLTTVLRPSVKSAPLFAFSAPTPGTGKSTLADLVGIMATGKPCAAMDFNRDEAEFKKSLFATLLEGSPVVLIDNVVGELNDSKLNQVLTQEETKGRVLGVSENSNISFCSIWLATGNNLTICGDLTRRTLLCTLDAETEKPAERVFSRNIYKWTNDHRGELVQAALTILRAYHLEGRQLPDGIKPMNSFNDWSRWVRGALLWLGEADPRDSQGEIEAHDPERECLRAVLHAWHERWGSEFVTTKDLLKRGTVINDVPDKQDALYQALDDAVPHRGELTGKQLGKWLAKHDKRIIDRLKLINTGERDGDRNYWKVIET